MKRTKRKYTRKATTTLEESKSRGIEGEGSVIPQVSLSGGIPDDMVLPDSVTTSTGGEFIYADLPLSVRMGVENTLKLRKRLGLPDDSIGRKKIAVKMFRGDRPR